MFIDAMLNEFVQNSPGNYISGEQALTPSSEGMRIYDAPLVGIADASDPLFKNMLEPQIIGPHFRCPEEWLAGARSVISVFLPYSEDIKKANSATVDEVAPEWLHGRYTAPYEYCTLCGKCIDRCPAGAISIESGKNQKLCGDYVHQPRTDYPDYYGCGKCQTGVPCQSSIPQNPKK